MRVFLFRLFPSFPKLSNRHQQVNCQWVCNPNFDSPGLFISHCHWQWQTFSCFKWKAGWFWNGASCQQWFQLGLKWILKILFQPLSWGSVETLTSRNTSPLWFERCEAWFFAFPHGFSSFLLNSGGSARGAEKFRADCGVSEFRTPGTGFAASQRACLAIGSHEDARRYSSACDIAHSNFAPQHWNVR